MCVRGKYKSITHKSITHKTLHVLLPLERNVCVNMDFNYTVKVKCTLVQALRLCTGGTAHRGSRGIALLFLDHGTRRG